MINLQEFADECRADIPLLTAMELALTSFDDLILTMEAPLAPNINNKGTAFGGSIASICLFGGWAAATLAFRNADIHNTEIVVYKNEMTFERPATGHLTITTEIHADDYAACLARLHADDRRRIKLHIDAELFHDDQRCATMRGVYVVWLKD